MKKYMKCGLACVSSNSQAPVAVWSIVISLFLFLLCYSSSVSAGNLSPNADKIYLGGGISIPNGILSDGWNLGFHGKAGAGFVLAERDQLPVFELVLETSYHSFGLKKFGTNAKGGTVSTFMLGLGPRFSYIVFPSRLHISFGVVLGAAYVNVSDLTFQGSSIQFLGGDTREFFVSPSIGVDLIKSSFLSIGHVVIKTNGEDLTYTPLTIGMRF